MDGKKKIGRRKKRGILFWEGERRRNRMHWEIGREKEGDRGR